MSTEDGRYVGVRARYWTHAVWVPHDLPTDNVQIVQREGRAPLAFFPGHWSGRSECGQLVRRIHAGPNRGHDWERSASHDQCPRCLRAVRRKAAS